LDEVIALHPILAGAAIGKVQRVLRADGVIVQFPEIGEVKADAESYRPMEIATPDRSMRVAL
jgi:hypothetical protein